MFPHATSNGETLEQVLGEFEDLFSNPNLALEHYSSNGNDGRQGDDEEDDVSPRDWRVRRSNKWYFSAWFVDMK